MSNRRLKSPETYQEPGAASRSRCFRYRYPNLQKMPGFPVRPSWSDHVFYPSHCLEALTLLGVPHPGQSPMPRGA